MQNQLTPGQSNLQQSNNNLQPNSGGLQQGGAPTTSSEVFNVLSQNAQSNGLKVRAAQTDPNSQPKTYLPHQSVSTWLIPMVLVVALIVAVSVWLRLRELSPVVEKPVVVPEPPKQATPRKKTKANKKTTRRKRQTKR